MIINNIPKLLSISIMAHPSRARFFPYLLKRLGYDTPISIDEKSEGVWPNCRRAWQMHDKNSLYHLVVQDDAIVCENFRERAEAAIQDMIKRGFSGHALNFYFGGRKSNQEEGKRGLERGFLTKHSPSWGVAICLETRWIDEMLEYTKRFDTWRDDERIAGFLAHKQIRSYFPMPSLIDHRGGAETPSLVGDPGDKRFAFAFIDNLKKS